MQAQPNRAPHRTDRARGSKKRVAPGVYTRAGRYLIGYTDPAGRERLRTLGWIKTDAHPDGLTLTEAKAHREKLRVDVREGVGVVPTRRTFAEVVEEFLAAYESRVERGERSRRTLECYRQHLYAHVLPTLGRRPIQRISAGELSDWLIDLRKRRRTVNGCEEARLLSDWTLAGIWKAVAIVIRFALTRGYLSVNPLDRLSCERPVGKNQTSARILDATDVARLIACTSTTYRALIAAAAFTGMRQGELLGLTWADVDLENGLIHVRQQLQRGRHNEPPRRVRLKTAAAEREIDIAPQLGAVLAAHKLASSYCGDSDFVFATETGSPIHYRNASARGLTAAANRAGLNPPDLPPLSFHDLRHTAITHLIRSGADVAQVQRFAGHAKPSITLDIYVGEFDKRKVNDSGRRLGALYDIEAAHSSQSGTGI